MLPTLGRSPTAVGAHGAGDSSFERLARATEEPNPRASDAAVDSPDAESRRARAKPLPNVSVRTTVAAATRSRRWRPCTLSTISSIHRSNARGDHVNSRVSRVGYACNELDANDDGAGPRRGRDVDVARLRVPPRHPVRAEP